MHCHHDSAGAAFVAPVALPDGSLVWPCLDESMSERDITDDESERDITDGESRVDEVTNDDLVLPLDPVRAALSSWRSAILQKQNDYSKWPYLENKLLPN